MFAKNTRKLRPQLNPPDVPALLALGLSHPLLLVLSVTLPLQAGLFKSGDNSPPPHLVQAASETCHGQGLWGQAGGVMREACVGSLPMSGRAPGYVAWAKGRQYLFLTSWLLFPPAFCFV